MRRRDAGSFSSPPNLPHARWPRWLANGAKERHTVRKKLLLPKLTLFFLLFLSPFLPQLIPGKSSRWKAPRLSSRVSDLTWSEWRLRGTFYAHKAPPATVSGERRRSLKGRGFPPSLPFPFPLLMPLPTATLILSSFSCLAPSTRAIYFCTYSNSKSLFNELLPSDTPIVHICSAASAGKAPWRLFRLVW